MVPLRRVAPPRIFHLALGRVALLRPYGTSRVPWLPVPSVWVGGCKVHVDILAHPTNPTMTAWFTTARCDDLDGTLERAAHQALT
jgi:hypothetical protein